MTVFSALFTNTDHFFPSNAYILHIVHLSLEYSLSVFLFSKERLHTYIVEKFINVFLYFYFLTTTEHYEFITEVEVQFVLDKKRE